MEELHKRRIPVYLISGGFRVLIQPIAQELNIPIQNVYANRLKFYFNGEYFFLSEFPELPSTMHITKSSTTTSTSLDIFSINLI